MDYGAYATMEGRDDGFPYRYVRQAIRKFYAWRKLSDAEKLARVQENNFNCVKRYDNYLRSEALENIGFYKGYDDDE